MPRVAVNLSAQMRRVFSALNVSAYSDAAALLSLPDAPVAPTTVQSWNARGVPAWRLEQIAQRTGCRISWLRDGEGPQYDRNPGLVVSEPVSTYDALSPRERALLDNFRAIGEAAKTTLEQTGALFAQQAAAGSRRRSGQR